MLELRKVSKRFLGIAAVDNVSFSARAGEVTGYLGPNGSGKSTTMKMITGLIEPFSGLDIGTGLVLRSLIQELAARGKVVLFSSHELETVERVCSHVVILHRCKIVADDSIERLRTLMALPTLESIFSQLAVEQDTVAISRQIADLIRA